MTLTLEQIEKRLAFTPKYPHEEYRSIHHDELKALCTLARERLTEGTFQEGVSDKDAMALAVLNGHCDPSKLESYQTGFHEAVEIAAREAKMWGDQGKSIAATIRAKADQAIRQLKRTP